MSKSALVLGASGLVGGHCLDLLLADPTYAQVRVLVRSPLPHQNAKLQQHLCDFTQLEKYADLIRAQEVFCCLGTTIKKAGSQAAFRQVDFEYPRAGAELAVRNGAEQFLLVTALGASARSSIFYNQVKGELEVAMQKLPFRALHIFRPSLLLGRRGEFRRGEKIGEVLMKPLSFLLRGSWRKYRPIFARAVATAMVNVAKMNLAGYHIYESDRMQELAMSAP